MRRCGWVHVDEQAGPPYPPSARRVALYQNPDTLGSIAAFSFRPAIEPSFQTLLKELQNEHISSI
jgi:hypothetical protein